MAKVMLPKQIDPFQLASNETTLKGDLLLSEMVRLDEFLCEKGGVAQIHLQFGRDSQKYAYIKGAIKTKFKLLCQRCGEPMTLDFDIQVNDSPVRNDAEAERLPNRYEPLLVTDETMSLNTLIEEEILLSMPIVPKHPLEECQVKASDLTEWEEEPDASNAFSKLKKLLRE